VNTAQRQPWRRSGWRRQADLPLCSLAVLDAAFVAGLALLLWQRAADFDPVSTCRSLVASMVADMGPGFWISAGVLAVVVLATGLSVAHQYWSTQRMMRRLLGSSMQVPGRVALLASRVGLHDRTTVIHSSAVFTFCHGFRRPRVCVSTGLLDLLDDDELLAVLAHESHHAYHRDPLKILLSRATASGLFFLPVAAALRDMFLAGKELAADQATGPLPGGEGKLARALVKMLRAERPAWPTGVLAVGALSPTDARLRRLLASMSTSQPVPRPAATPSLRDWLISVALVMGIYLAGYSLPASTSPGWQAGRCSSPLAMLGS
jgi:Zn-dependent protease with chaperone function